MNTYDVKRTTFDVKLNTFDVKMNALKVYLKVDHFQSRFLLEHIKHDLIDALEIVEAEIQNLKELQSGYGRGVQRNQVIP